MKTNQKSGLVLLLVVCAMLEVALIGCKKPAMENSTPSTAEIESEVVSEEVSEPVSEEEPVIVNVILTRDEADAYIEELKKFAVEIELYLCEIKTVEQFEKYSPKLNDYMYGTNSIGFTFDYNSEQREDTDLDGICFFIAYYNFQYNSDNIGFSDFVSQEVLYTPVEKYQMELNGEE